MQIIQKSNGVKNINSSVGIIIVAYNDPVVLRRCLDSVKKSTWKNFKIIIVDNSTDSKVKQSLELEIGIHYLPMGGNFGFCRANNVGIQKSQELNFEYTLLLNHDTVVMPECISALVECCSSFGNNVAVGGKILYLGTPNKIWYAGGWLNIFMGVGIHDGFNKVDDGRFEVGREIKYVTGCCLLLPTSAFDMIGLLRDEMFMYLDDAEYSRRILKNGFSMRYEPRAVLYHDVGTGVGFRNYADYYLYFSIRNKPFVADGILYKAYLHVIGLFAGVAKLILYSTLPGIEKRPVKLRAIYWGMLDSLSSEERYTRRFPRLFQNYVEPLEPLR